MVARCEHGVDGELVRVETRRADGVVDQGVDGTRDQPDIEQGVAEAWVEAERLLVHRVAAISHHLETRRRRGCRRVDRRASGADAERLGR